MDKSTDSQPWWREPWPWLLMAGPALAIVGCAITIVLAFQNFSDQDVNDGGVKQGLVVSKPAPAQDKNR
ncbi:FixH family protein [Alcaligenes sp. WGS1538]|uniref:FixH family protein n=1 Tax=Alcaligenes sp. WGS1538 TaxID=3366811 RepID=UPI00372D6135